MAASIYQYNKLEIQSLDGKRLDISNSAVALDYFENILEPTVSMRIEVVNPYSIFNMMEIQGGEKVEIEIENKEGRFIFEDDTAMYVYKVSGLEAESQKESFTLHLVSREYFSNETSRCGKKYQPQNISAHVKDILKNTLKTEKYDDKNIEETSNQFTFIGNNKKPFHTLLWLAPKGIISKGKASGESGEGDTTDGKGKGTAGFFFFENKDGFNFKSIESLVSETQIGSNSADKKDIYSYAYTGVIQAGLIDGPEYPIYNFFVEKNMDVRKQLRVGMYRNYTYFYDIWNNQFSGYEYELDKELGKTLGKDEIVTDPKLTESVTRTMFRVSDHGILSQETGNEESGRDRTDMAKSYARYNLLFTQSLNISVPCNINLKVGDIIECAFPQKLGGKANSADPRMSGLYLIRELRHHFTANQNVTSLKLLRDSYGLYGSNE